MARCSPRRSCSSSCSSSTQGNSDSPVAEAAPVVGGGKAAKEYVKAYQDYNAAQLYAGGVAEQAMALDNAALAGGIDKKLYKKDRKRVRRQEKSASRKLLKSYKKLVKACKQM